MILKKGTIIGLGILAVVVVLVIGVVGWGFSAYNNLVAADENVQAKASNIDADLTRRADLVPNLVNTVKGGARQAGRQHIPGGPDRGGQRADPGFGPAPGRGGKLSRPESQ